MSAAVLGRLRDLVVALESVAEATAGADASRLSACEAPLEHALTSLPSVAELSPADANVARRLLQQIQRALNRCRTVGGATTELVVASLAAQGIAHGYRPTGAGVSGPRLGRMGVRV